MAVKAKRNAGTVKPAVKRAVNSAAKQSVPADTKPVAKKAPAKKAALSATASVSTAEQFVQPAALTAAQASAPVQAQI